MEQKPSQARPQHQHRTSDRPYPSDIICLGYTMAGIEILFSNQPAPLGLGKSQRRGATIQRT
jgi:hypothetical protein